MDIHGGDTDFDLFWGMGPSSTSNNNNGGGTDDQQQQQQHNNNSSSLRSGRGGLGDIDVASPSGGALGGSRGSGGLDPTPTTLMGSFWSHGRVPHLEDYGHQHHVHVHASRPEQTASPPQTTAVRSGTASGGDAVIGSHSSGSSGGANALEGKLEELAAAITSSVLGKLDVGVREALANGQQQQQQPQLQHQQQQQRGGDSFVPLPSAATGSSSASASAAQEDSQRRAAAAAVEAAAAPLRSRLADLEEQVSRLTAAAAAADRGSSGDARSRGGRSGGGAGGGVGLGRGGGGGNPASAVAATEPHVALTALAQRTGTLEGRHKQVQAKVALLDNAFGPKASDWAQTIKAFIQEREATAAAAAPAGGGGRAATAASKGRGGKAGKKRLDIDAPVFSPRPTTSNANAPAESEAAAAAGTAASTAESVAGTKRDDNESAPEVVGEAPPSDGTDVAGAATAARATTAAAETAAEKEAGAVGVVDRCSACAETEERCNRLEERVTELSLAQGRAAAAAATATADAAKAREIAEGSRRDVAAAVTAATEKEASLELSRRQQKVPAPAAATAEGGGGKWASKGSVEKLAGELRQLLKRVKDGADAVALVDYAVKDIRDEIAPLSGTVSALKRLVETQLREKGQAAELLKGYVTTITREVAAITRQYINGLVAPGVLAAAAAASKLGGGGGGDAVQGAADGVAAAASAAGPTTGGAGSARVTSTDISGGSQGAVPAGAEGNA